MWPFPKSTSLIASRNWNGSGGNSRIVSLNTWNKIKLTVIFNNCEGEKLSESWPNFKFSDFHEMFKNVAEGKRMSQDKENVSFVTVCLDLFPVEAKKLIVFVLPTFREVLCTQITVANYTLMLSIPLCIDKICSNCLLPSRTTRWWYHSYRIF
jgi:hypothetical protein